MTDSALQRAGTWVLFGLLGVALALAGYWLLFTTFMIYDDEGYVLLTLRNFSEHGGLYDRVYTQYGPFPYLLLDALHRLFGFTFDNTSGRWITLVNWLGTAATCAALVGRTTRSRLWAAFTLAGTFTYLWIMVNEPSHPGGLISLIIALATWLAAEAWTRRRLGWFVAITGLACAVLTLTKINVGAFFFAAVAAMLALNADSRSVARKLGWLGAVGCVALPFGLMHSLFDEQWVRMFALVFACGILGTLLASAHVAQPLVRPVRWIEWLAWVAATTAVLGALTLVRGTSFSGLIDGVVIEPLKHPGVYSFAVKWRAGTGVVALCSLALAAWLAHTRRWEDPRVLRVLAITRVVSAGFAFAGTLGLTPTTLALWGLCFGVPLAWLFIVPLQRQSPTVEVRVWLALVLTFEALQAYPIAGSQLNWGTYLWIPLLALGLQDAAPLLLPRRAGLRACFRWVGTGLVTIVVLQMTGQLFQRGWNWYVHSQRLGLAGAERIRLPNDITYALRILNENLQEHADLLFSFPGLYSANLWTDLPTPTLANATHWFSLLSEAQQQAIIDQLSSHPRAAVLVQRELLRFLEDHGFHPRGLLHSWLATHFTPVFGVGGYEIWIQRGRTVAPLSLAEPRFRPDGSIDALTLTLRQPQAAISRIELCDIDHPETPLFTFSSENTTLTLTPCGMDGQATGTATATAFPARIEGIGRLELRFRSLNVGGATHRLLLVLRDAAGTATGELVIADRPVSVGSGSLEP